MRYHCGDSRPCWDDVGAEKEVQKLEFDVIEVRSCFGSVIFGFPVIILLLKSVIRTLVSLLGPHLSWVQCFAVGGRNYPGMVYVTDLAERPDVRIEELN